jgi:CDP-glucose 4,6-dehydratase
VLEPLAGYLLLAQKLWAVPALAGAYNFGPPTHEAATVQEVVQLALSEYGKGQVDWGDGNAGPHEAGWLALEVAKARTLLGIKSRWPLAESVRRTVQWYRLQQQGARALELCEADLAAYETEKNPIELHEPLHHF